MYQSSRAPAAVDVLHSTNPLNYRTSYFDAGCRTDKSRAAPITHGNAVLRRDGLHTPPSDDMASTAFQQPSYGSYVSRSEGTYSSSTYSSAVLPRPQIPQPTRTTSSQSTTDHSHSHAYSHPRPPSPRDSRSSMISTDHQSRRKSSTSDSIIPKLQIPSSVNDSGGSIAEFAAQITCLFWFESTDTLRSAENHTLSSSPIKRLVPAAIPSSGFRKWVVTILSTTQVTQNVILLALMFIYRLKTLNPTVQGKVGSEYRLLTVALMLGNKFLDDNTYTNKTWAEVSGISVGEIHVMEVEFLSNMRYSLYASKEEWKEWQTKLGKFHDYFEKASRVPLALPSPIPSNLSQNSLPSPPGTIHNASPALAAQSSPVSYQPNKQWNHPQYGTLPLPSVPELDLPQQRRKRSIEEDYPDHPAKRITRTTPLSQVVTATTPVSVPTTTSMTMPVATMAPMQSAPRLPVPQLSISTSQPSMAYPPVTSAYVPAMTQLPPLNNRAMANVYTPHTPTWPVQMPLGATPQTSQGHNSVYSTPSRRQSPGSAHLAIGSSPTSATFPLNHHSPSIFLQQRSSPYKPIRHVNTLLYPPPSGSVHAQAPHLDQMHYQPLGKRNDYRSGVVPEYASHPAYQGWPILPQPNFNV